MSCAADSAEDELRARPMDAAAVRRLEALYALADETWERIQALRARLSGGPSGHLLQPAPRRTRGEGLAAGAGASRPASAAGVTV